MKPRFMLLLSIVTLAGVLLCLGPAPAHAAKIKVVTTLTDLADFTREIGETWSRFTAWPRASKILTGSR